MGGAFRRGAVGAGRAGLRRVGRAVHPDRCAAAVGGDGSRIRAGDRTARRRHRHPRAGRRSVAESRRPDVPGDAGSGRQRKPAGGPDGPGDRGGGHRRLAAPELSGSVAAGGARAPRRRIQRGVAHLPPRTRLSAELARDDVRQGNRDCLGRRGSADSGRSVPAVGAQPEVLAAVPGADVRGRVAVRGARRRAAAPRPLHADRRGHVPVLPAGTGAQRAHRLSRGLRAGGCARGGHQRSVRPVAARAAPRRAAGRRTLCPVCRHLRAAAARRPRPAGRAGALFLILAAIMYATRAVDWHAAGSKPERAGGGTR